MLIIALRRGWRQAAYATVKSGWPLLLPALAGLGTYVAVHVEDRYISAFVSIIALFSLAPLLDPKLPSRKSLTAALMLIYMTGSAVELARIDDGAFRAALYHADFHSDPQWRLAAALSARGLKPGDAVAVIRDSIPPWRCSWAYVSGLCIVAEFGSLPWRVALGDRTRFDPNSGPGYTDFGELFWSELGPEQRAQIIKAFATTGARAIVSLSKPNSAPATGWQHLVGTGAWINDFREAQ